MEQVVARPSLWRMILLVICGFGFIAFGTYILGWIGEAPKPGKEWLGWVMLAIFVPATIMLFVRMFDTGDVMRISAQGIYYRYWSEATIPWNAIEKIIIWSYRGQKTIVLKLVDVSQYPASSTWRKLVSLNSRTAGGDIAINLARTNLSTRRALRAIEHFSGREL